jgi:hypothetical protein
MIKPTTRTTVSISIAFSFLASLVVLSFADPSAEVSVELAVCKKLSPVAFGFGLRDQVKGSPLETRSVKPGM